jgi:hydrogenase maturation protease
LKYKKIALIGIGNILFYDEGMGAYLAKYIQDNYQIPDNLTVIEGGTLGFTLMTYYQEYDKVIIVGTSSKEASVGTIFSENDKEIIADENTTRKTANEAEITMMLEICSFHEDMGEVQLISMVAKDIIEVKNGLTKEVLKNMPNLVEATIKELENSQIELKRNNKNVSFEEVIEFYKNPKQSFDFK